MSSKAIKTINKIPKMKTCRVCKNKFTPSRPLQMLCSVKCSYKYVELLNAKKAKHERKEMSASVYVKENKTDLQNEINRLARMIDNKFNYPCIDCGGVIRYKGNERQSMDANGSHFHNVKGNENIRYNLHNIHTAKIQCNKWLGGRKPEYKLGLISRYGTEYFEFVDGLGLTYKSIHLNHVEIVEKLKIVRKLIRTFDTFVIRDGHHGRSVFNKLIGIYL